MQPKVSVIIVNWNRLADVRLALDFLAKIHYPRDRVEAIVVDNGSTDGSIAEFSKRPDLIFVPLPKNEGPCIARNRGVDAATGDYVFFLDSDAVLGKRTLAHMVAALEEDPTIGLMACRIDNWHSRRIDQWIYAEPHERRTRQVFDTYAFSAAGALLLRDVFTKVGGFNEKLHIYNEEVDFSVRLLKLGLRIVYDSEARVYHRPSLMGRAPGRDYWRLMIRNWIWIFWQHYPAPEAWRRIALYCAIYVYKGVRVGQLRACMTGIKEGLARRGEFTTPASAKLNRAQIERIDALNPRRRILVGRG